MCLITVLWAYITFECSNGSGRCSDGRQHAGIRLRRQPARVGVELRIVAHLERVVVVRDAELAVQEPEEPVGLVHQHRRRTTAAAARGPPRHKLAERGGAGAHGVVGRRDRLHGGQRVREALVVEERAGKKLPGLAAAASRTVKSSSHTHNNR